MTALLPVICLAVVILILGIRLLWQSLITRDERVVTIDDFSHAREALDLMFIENEAVARIFSAEDADFIAHVAPTIQSEFFRERKKLAVQWLRGVQKQLARLMDLHLRLAGYTYNTSPRFEFQLTLRYLTFRVVSNIVLLLVSLVGPFNASRTLALTMTASASLCTAFSLRLEQINPTLLQASEECMAD